MVSEEELWDLKTLKATRTAVALIHSVDRCPQCPTEFDAIWRLVGKDQEDVAEMMARLAASMVDDLASLHHTPDKANQARAALLHTYAGSHLIDIHYCHEGHTGCAAVAE